MPRRAASITQADLRRAIEAAKKAGASAVEVRIGNGSVITIRITPSSSEGSPEPSQDIVL